MSNIYTSIPIEFDKEIFEELIGNKHVKIEKILSRGHTSPASGWYDQSENEWVIVLEGAGTLIFEDGREITLQKGDYLNIPSHTRHRVIWTEPDKTTIWLAVFYTN